MAAAFLSSAPSPSVLRTASCIRGFTHKRRKTLMRKAAAPVQVSVRLHHALGFNCWRITAVTVGLSTCLRFPKDLMTGDLYPSFDMKRFVLALCSDKRLSITGTGVAISSNPHLAPLYISLGTKKPSSDTEMEKEPCRKPSLFWPFLFLTGTRGVQAPTFWMRWD